MPANKDYLPQKDPELLAWTKNFATGIAADPIALSLTEAQSDQYGVKQADFDAALKLATDPATRGPRTVFLKNETKKILVTATRQIAKQISAFMTVTPAQRQALGLPVSTGERKSKPAPDQSPVITIENVSGRTVSVRLRQAGNKRAKPADAALATILTTTSAERPMTMDAFVFAFNTSRTTVDVPFPPSETGDTVWITAVWLNAKGEVGPFAFPVSVDLPAGGVIKTTGSTKMKIAKAA